MRVYILAIAVTFALSADIGAYMQESQPFIYDDEGMRDPFSPLVTKDGKIIMSYGVIRSINDVVVEGIIYEKEGDAVVIINGIILKENDRVGDMRVVRIEKERVVLNFKNKEYTLQIKE